MNRENYRRNLGTLASAVRGVAIAAVLGLGGCSTVSVPTAQSIQGLTPSGRVRLTETFVAGTSAGSGTLTFNGQTYPFRLLGSVIGPGGGADRITASGEVYKLSNVNDFQGSYAQGSGPAGLSRSGNGHLWLQNNHGVIMHLYSTSSGVLLSIGEEEIVVRLSR
jgi:hypothetical protein